MAVIKIIFGFLCGILYGIGYVFGLSYVDTSVYICIYLCPIICILYALVSTIYTLRPKGFFNRVLFSLNASLLLMYLNTTAMFWEHYSVQDPFTLCMNDLKTIAQNMNITYEEANLLVYCVLFFGIILFHITTVIINKKIKKIKTKNEKNQKKIKVTAIFKAQGGTNTQRFPMMGGLPVLQFSQNNNSGEKKDQNVGHAIYLHYPNFMGRSSNAIKIGNVDIGQLIGNPSIPVGHAAAIFIDPDGKSTYYEYGRYEPKNGHLIGTEKRPTSKGGNWRRISLKPQRPGEDDSTYVTRIQSSLPDTNTGAYQAMTISNVDTKKAAEWINGQANDKNREEYNITNTCADGACNAIFPFQTKTEYHPTQTINPKGYSFFSSLWSTIPFLSTGAHARTARAKANKVYVMNNKK